MSDWRECRLGDLIKVHHGYAFSGDQMTGDLTGAPIVVSIGNFSYTGGFRFSSTRVREFRGAYPKEFELHAGDLLVIMTCQTAGGEILGVPAFVPDDGRVYLHNQRIGRVECDDSRLFKRFGYYLFLSAEVNRQLFNTSSGTKILHTSPSRISEVRVSVPCLSEQQNIAEALGALDDKIALNERLAATADGLADSIFAQYARKDRLEPMSRLMAPILGGTPDRKVHSYWGSGIPWASAKDVASATAGVVAETEEQITEEAVSGTRVKLLPERSVFLTARGTVGAVARIVRPMAINQSCYAFRPGQIPPAVLFHLVRSGAGKMLSVAHGTVFSTVNMKTFDHVLVPAVAVEVRSALEKELAPLHRQIEARIEESRTLAALRDTLLPRLMSGKLRVRDAEKIVEDAV